MPDSFKMSNLPFSLLNEREQKLLRANLDIGYYQKGEALLQAPELSEGVYVIFKGRVAEVDPDAEDGIEHVFMHYENEDYFGGWSAIQGTTIHNFVAEEETICHILPTATLLELMATNEDFADYFQQNLSAKSQIAAQQGEGQDMAEFMLAKVSDVSLRDPLIVNQGTTLSEATALMRQTKSDCVLVRKGSRIGMVTGTDLLDAVVLNALALDTD